YSRQEAGHWEADTVVSGHGKSKACFATLAERKTRYYIAVKIPNRRAETMENAIVSVLSAFPPQLVKIITCDRGTEFANWRNIEERLHCDVYFTDPYCAWQKGTNENLNGLLREFYPKGRNLSRVAPATLKRTLALINARPRKVLNFHSAQDYGPLSSIPVALSLTIYFDFHRIPTVLLSSRSNRVERLALAWLFPVYFVKKDDFFKIGFTLAC
ncbi:IS30 family transposase, partial [[Clostridium] leptum]